MGAAYSAPPFRQRTRLAPKRVLGAERPANAARAERYAASSAPAAQVAVDRVAAQIATIANEYELVVRASKHLEGRLRARYGSQLEGKGLSELVLAAQTRREMPEALARDLRVVSSARNKLVHHAQYDSLQSRRDFVAAFRRASDALR